MKKLSLFLLVIMIILLGAAAYLRLGARLIVTNAAVNVRGASTAPEEWASLFVDLTDGAFQGRVIADAGMSNSDDFEFRTYSIGLRNLGMLRAEWITIAVRAEEGDIIEYGEQRGFSLAPYSGGTITVRTLALASSPVERVVTVSYYVYGRPFSIETLVR